MELGSWADWVSGVSTAAALAATLYVVFQEKRERLTERAETLGSYLMPDDNADRDRYQAMSLKVIASGRDEFRRIRLYRIVDIEGPTGRRRIELTAVVPPILPGQKLTCEGVLTSSRFPRDVHQHYFSAMTFRFRGADWITYADEYPRKLNVVSRRRLRTSWDRARSVAPIDDVVRIGPTDWKQSPPPD